MYIGQRPSASNQPSDALEYRLLYRTHVLVIICYNMENDPAIKRKLMAAHLQPFWVSLVAKE